MGNPYAIPREKLLKLTANHRKITIGLPTPPAGCDRRFPLTPEAASLLVERGFTVKIQQGGSDSIHYTDLRYQQHGVDIVDRGEAFRCDIVIYLAPLTGMDARSLRNGAMLLTFTDSAVADATALGVLVQNSVITLALDLIEDSHGLRPFADILAEIAGRAAMSIANSLLADSDHGKGILLGGVAGIIPCEVTIMGSGISACAAARSAMGLGAIVKMFDNDVYSLRAALRDLGAGITGSSMHPRVLAGALRTADVVIATDARPAYEISSDVVSEMKEGVVIFDITTNDRMVFPSLPPVDIGNTPLSALASLKGRRTYLYPATAVPRTVAMALSNTFITMITEIFTCNGITNALMLNGGLQRAVLTFMGKPTNARVAARLGVRPVDINLILQFS